MSAYANLIAFDIIKIFNAYLSNSWRAFIHIYVAGSIGMAVSAFILMIPMGVFISHRPAIFGGISALLAILGWVALGILNGVFPTIPFAVEYGVLIFSASVAAHFGNKIRAKIQNAKNQ